MHDVDQENWEVDESNGLEESDKESEHDDGPLYEFDTGEKLVTDTDYVFCLETVFIITYSTINSYIHTSNMLEPDYRIGRGHTLTCWQCTFKTAWNDLSKRQPSSHHYHMDIPNWTSCILTLEIETTALVTPQMVMIKTMKGQDWLSAKTCTDDMDILDNETPVDLWLNEGSDKEEAHFQSIGKSLVEAGEMVLQQAGKDQGIWMQGMTRHDLMTKAMAVIEDFLRVMHWDEHSRLGHTWLKGITNKLSHSENLFTYCCYMIYHLLPFPFPSPFNCPAELLIRQAPSLPRNFHKMAISCRHIIASHWLAKALKVMPGFIILVIDTNILLSSSPLLLASSSRSVGPSLSLRLSLTSKGNYLQTLSVHVESINFHDDSNTDKTMNDLILCSTSWQAQKFINHQLFLPGLQSSIMMPMLPSPNHDRKCPFLPVWQSHRNVANGLLLHMLPSIGRIAQAEVVALLTTLLVMSAQEWAVSHHAATHECNVEPQA
ncbi:uncharacterized protein EI90DRAFT_3021242 [Cantharellus anzutake]|uniref:uncharacterized protein n=1 Tax=Cantharellus anzutake TaxID=1750568 RepID=UPI00190591F2|nr:uncharacterized protein EI90DRAFT_3021242 [Cantharellus anzutake]KAF8317842.1 hypothetical protein EI90DRAFT_3021242 [Cantharellus anzutake]